MLLIPKAKKFLYVSSESFVPVEKIELKLNTVYEPLENSKPMISFNGFQFEPFYDKMKIPKQYHEAKSLNIRIRLVDRHNPKKFREYVSDTLAVTKITLVGMAVEEGYPQIYAKTEDRISQLEKEVDLLKNALLEHVNAGTII